jgi:cation transport regulator ChaB
MFQSIRELPAVLRTSLPREAQELYRAAYNRTWEILAAGKGTNQQRMNADAHRAARIAVEYEFSRDEQGNWRRNSVGEDMTRRGTVGSDPTSKRKP